MAAGAAFYVVAAACGASDSSSGARDGGASSGGGIIDAITDPVTEANADVPPGPPDVATEPCDKPGFYNGTSSAFYAVHAYPGKSAVDLSAVRVLAHFGPSSVARTTVNGSAFDYQGNLPVVRDGEVAVYCGTSAPLTFDSVTFILPP